MVILVALAVAPRVRVSKDPMGNCTVLIATKNSSANGLGSDSTCRYIFADINTASFSG